MRVSNSITTMSKILSSLSNLVRLNSEKSLRSLQSEKVGNDDRKLLFKIMVPDFSPVNNRVCIRLPSCCPAAYPQQARMQMRPQQWPRREPRTTKLKQTSRSTIIPLNWQAPFDCKLFKTDTLKRKQSYLIWCWRNRRIW